ncbi:Gfo/Idh/MocA family oxidoreductase [Seonamhaeicola sp.]|uniref:Gfo/Idh/MocA family protein n=1 Tax=Seonamhaeicola sp. TaxID=1912245 RepID=UPI0026132307|nr:Gfo/Idh/MocA family oxidoreductase [Seonamhaeicola sp.]
MLHSQTNQDQVRMAVIGLSHDHVHWILGKLESQEIKVIGIVEANKALAKRYSDQYGYPMAMVYDSMEALIAAAKPEAVAAFGPIDEHLEVVETFAPLGIHVMVEKPLAVSLEHAKKMEALAKTHKIHLITNYETTWYASNHKAHKMIQNGVVGDLRKVVVHDGHKGPSEIGVSKEFLSWLTDPDRNGGGALTDFGCYGVNLITWLNGGERPESVTAITQTMKPDVYPKVDDEATIILRYPKLQGIVQASWNWPISRKDMEVYGVSGYVICENRTDIKYRLSERTLEAQESLKERQYPYNDPFAFFAAVVNGEITLAPYDLSSLENNMIVMEVLEAAKESAATGKTIKLK